MFSLKSMCNIFPLHLYCAIKFDYMVFIENDLLVDFKCTRANFHKQKKEPAKDQYPGITPLSDLLVLDISFEYPLVNIDTV